MQDPVFKTPTAWTWNTTVERELPASTRLSLSYVGRRGYYNSRLRNVSQELRPGLKRRCRSGRRGMCRNRWRGRRSLDELGDRGVAGGRLQDEQPSGIKEQLRRRASEVSGLPGGGLALGRRQRQASGGP